VVSSRLIFLTEMLYVFLIFPMRAARRAHPILDSIVLIIGYLVKSRLTNHAAPHYAVLSILLSLHPSYVQIFSSAPCSQTLTILCYSHTVTDQALYLWDYIFVHFNI
jgi:hypothetical protein